MTFTLMFRPDLPQFPFLLIDRKADLTTVIRMKQQIYSHDHHSGYGLAHSLSSVKETSDMYKGIPLSADVAEEMITDEKANHLSDDPWIRYIRKLASVPLLPAPDGHWFFQFIPLPVPPEINVIERDLIKTQWSDGCDWQTWLISFITRTKHFKTKRRTMINNLKLYANHTEIAEWTKIIGKDESAPVSLAPPYYQLAFQIMNDQAVPEAFQLELILHEPDCEHAEWLLKIYVRELSENKRVAYEDVLKGRHPYSTNPFLFLRQSTDQVLHLFSSVGISPKIQEGLMKLSDNEMMQFVNDILPECTHLGINCWLPSSLKQSPDLAICLQLSEEAPETPGSWVTSGITWTLKLDDKEMEQKLFRQLVEEERSVIHFHDRWYLWNQEDAAKLLKTADQVKPETLLFRGLRQQAADREKVSTSPANGSRQEINVDGLIEHMRTHTPMQICGSWKDQLRSYQQEGLAWLLGMRRLGLGAILADDMGLGKSRQVMAYIDHSKNGLEASRFLIVCPSSLLHHWDQELSERFCREQILIHDGPVAKRREQFHNSFDYKHVIHVVSFATLVRDRALFETIHWTALIIDEAQKIKNPRTQQRKATAGMSAAHTIALTGTPVENHPEELISLSNLINPGYLSDPEVPQHGSAIQPDLLKRMIRPMMLRRTKEEVQKDLNLPAKYHHHHRLSLSFEQETMYKAVVEEMFDQYEEASEPAKRAALFRTMMKLKQICNHPAQARKELGPRRFSNGRSPKWDLANELLTEWQHQGKRAIVFTQFRYAGQLFQEMQLIKGKTAVPFLHGGLTTLQRKDMIDSFKSNPDIPFMIISLRAGGFGLNLTEASAVLHFDRWWNPAVEDQATDRVHRIGQEKAVEVHTLTAEGTIEERIDDLIQKKQQLQQALIDGRPLPLWSLSEPELRDLFSLHH